MLDCFKAKREAMTRAICTECGEDLCEHGYCPSCEPNVCDECAKQLACDEAEIGGEA